MIKYSGFLGSLVFFVAAGTSLGADDKTLTIDWSTRSQGPQACPTNITAPTAVTITLSNVNDVLFTYGLSSSCVYMTADASNIGGIIGQKSITSPDKSDQACDAALKSAHTLRTIGGLYPDHGVSVSLDQTIAAWNTNSNHVASVQAIDPSQCSTYSASQLELVATVKSRMDDFATRINGRHEQKFVFSMDKDQLCSLKIRETDRYTRVGTSEQLTWRCGVDDTLTLSLGALLTSINYRDYTHRKIPTSSSGSIDALVVEGQGRFTPIGVGLLNYKLFHSDWGPRFGVTLSSGPAFKLGGSSDVSAIGWFAGASLSVHRRFYISPGFHIGQFADFPQGFVPGQKIPDNFGELTPVKRWTSRFSIGLTFMTNSLKSSSTGQGQSASSKDQKTQSNEKPK